MTASIYGEGRSLPKNGITNQVPVIDPSDTAAEFDVTWKPNGSRPATAIKAGSYPAVFGEVIPVDTTAAGRTITLPTPVAGSAPITIFRQAGSNDVTVAGTINGSTNETITTTAKTYYSTAAADGYYSL